MKRFLCALLAICMLGGAAALAGCKKGGKSNGTSSSRPANDYDGVTTEEGIEGNPEW